jgi:hypothetical protein
MIGQEPLHEGDGVLAVDPKAAHVGDIEKASISPGGQMLFQDSSRIGDGHMPSGKLDHLRPMILVPGVQGGPLQFAHDSPAPLIGFPRSALNNEKPRA